MSLSVYTLAHSDKKTLPCDLLPGGVSFRCLLCQLALKFYPALFRTYLRMPSYLKKCNAQQLLDVRNLQVLILQNLADK